MAFSADIVAVKLKYNEQNIWPAIHIMNNILSSYFGVKIKGEISFDKYLRESASKPINRYLRMPLTLFQKLMPHANLTDKPKQQKDTVDVVYDSGRNDSPQFANSRHFVVNFSSLESYTLIWFNFHPILYTQLEGFSNIHTAFTRAMSIKYNTEAIFMNTSSVSRSDAAFVIYASGNMRGSENGKDALTVLKNDYSVDINKCMDNIDNNIAIYYAPFDLASVNKQIYDQTQRLVDFEKCSEELIIQNKTTGENMVAGFMEDNEKIMTTLNARRKRVEEAMGVEGFGTLIFLELDKEPIRIKVDLKSETFFGKRS